MYVSYNRKDLDLPGFSGKIGQLGYYLSFNHQNSPEFSYPTQFNYPTQFSSAIQFKRPGYLKQLY